MGKGNWIKLHRSLIEWEWWDDHNATRLLVCLLLSVNYEDKRWKGVLIKAGSMVLSWDTLSSKSGLTVKQCRIAMKKLEGAGEVAREVTNRFQLVTLAKWEKLQAVDHEVGRPMGKQEGRQRAGKGQAEGRQRATTKESKEYKEGKEYKRGGTKKFVPPTLQEVDDYVHLKNFQIDPERFIAYYESNGWMVGRNKMKDWKAAVRSWASRSKEKSSGKKEKTGGKEFFKQRAEQAIFQMNSEQ